MRQSKAILVAAVLLALIVVPSVNGLVVINQDRTVVGEVRQEGNDYKINGTLGEYAESKVEIRGVGFYQVNSSYLDLGTYRSRDFLGSVFGRTLVYTNTSTHLFGLNGRVGFDASIVTLRKDYVNRTTWAYNYSWQKPSDQWYRTTELWSQPITGFSRCKGWNSYTWACRGGFEQVYDVKVLEETNQYVTFVAPEFSGWFGTSNFYADFEGVAPSLCSGGEGYTGGLCDAPNIIGGDWTETVFMDVESAAFNDTTGNRAYVYKSFTASSREANQHHSRIYIYLDPSFDATADYHILGATNAGYNTVSAGFLLDSSENLRCFFDTSSANYNLTKSGPISISTGEWHYIEYYINKTVHPSVGDDMVQCWVDGVLQANLTGLRFGDVDPGRLATVGHPINIDRANPGLYFVDEHRVAPRYIGGYPVIASINDSLNASGNIFDSLSTTVNASVSDPDGDLHTVLLRWWDPAALPLSINNISMDSLGGDWYDQLVHEDNYTRIPAVSNNIRYDIWANDSNGQEIDSDDTNIIHIDSGISTKLETANGTVFRSSNIALTCNTTDEQLIADLWNITLYTNLSGTWSVQSVLDLTSNSSYSAVFSLASVPDGSYLWNCQGFQYEYVESVKGNNSAFAGANFTFIVDAHPRDVNVVTVQAQVFKREPRRWPFLVFIAGIGVLIYHNMQNGKKQRKKAGA